MRAVLGIARTLGHRRIVASHFIDNPASGRFLQKLGFGRTGRIQERFSPWRGHASPAREFALRLDTSCDRDGDGGGLGGGLGGSMGGADAARRKAA